MDLKGLETENWIRVGDLEVLAVVLYQNNSLLMRDAVYLDSENRRFGTNLQCLEERVSTLLRNVGNHLTRCTGHHVTQNCYMNSSGSKYGLERRRFKYGDQQTCIAVFIVYCCFYCVLLFLL